MKFWASMCAVSICVGLAGCGPESNHTSTEDQHAATHEAAAASTAASTVTVPSRSTPSASTRSVELPATISYGALTKMNQAATRQVGTAHLATDSTSTASGEGVSLAITNKLDGWVDYRHPNNREYLAMTVHNETNGTAVDSVAYLLKWDAPAMACQAGQDAGSRPGVWFTDGVEQLMNGFKPMLAAASDVASPASMTRTGTDRVSGTEATRYDGTVANMKTTVWIRSDGVWLQQKQTGAPNFSTDSPAASDSYNTEIRLTQRWDHFGEQPQLPAAKPGGRCSESSPVG